MNANIISPEILPFVTERVEIQIPSELQYVDPVVTYLMEHLGHFGIDEPADSNTCTALHEALTNAIRHGNQLDSGKKVTITVELTHQQATFTITDEGQGFDPSQICDPTEDEHLLHHCGRGLLLIRHYMDEVRYNERGNQVTMIKKSSVSSQ
jgi:serine/threonine-protein kinase RsbW